MTGAKGATGANGTDGAEGAIGPKGTSASVHVIGEQYQGGIIFYVDADGQHGLISAKADQDTYDYGSSWSDRNNTVPQMTYYAGAVGNGLYAGIQNTSAIIAEQNVMNAVNLMNSSPNSIVPVSSAAQLVSDYSVQDDGVTACTAATMEGKQGTDHD